VGSIDIRAQGKQSFGAGTARAITSSPVLEAAFDEMDTNQHHGGTGHEGWKDSAENWGREEGEQDFNKSAHTRSSKDCTISIRTW